MMFDEMSYETRQTWHRINEEYWDCVRLEKSCKRFLWTARIAAVVFFLGGLAFLYNKMWFSALVWIGCSVYWQYRLVPKNEQNLKEVRELVRDWETTRDNWDLPAFRNPKEFR